MPSMTLMPIIRRRLPSDGVPPCRSGMVVVVALLYLLRGDSHGLQLQRKTSRVSTRVGSNEQNDSCFHSRVDPTNIDIDTSGTTRRNVFRAMVGATLGTAVTICKPPISRASSDQGTPFVYSDAWAGTTLAIRTLRDATASDAYFTTNDTDGDGDGAVVYRWPMGKWPDPALRIPARRIDSSMWRLPENEKQLALAASILRDTARTEGAVGLAAQQCGVDARMVYLSSPSGGDLVLINPRIVARSAESKLKVWTEECLVLPPTFRATVLRDDWIDVEYDRSYEYRSKALPSSVSTILVEGEDVSLKKRFFGEQSRCLQHELDHDRGILITDHVGLEELENDVMRRIETEGHERRQAVAYSRE